MRAMFSTSNLIVRICFHFAYCVPLALCLPPENLNLAVSGWQAPSLPLAVRNPYLSAWLPGSQVDNLPKAQAEFWNSKQKLGWTILVQIDGSTFTLFGAPDNVANTTAAKQKSIGYTATHTTAILGAGGADITVDFFSPVSPNNHLRQSLPFNYVTISVSGGSDVSILTAIDDSWYGQPGNLVSQHQTKGTTSVITLTDPNAVDYKQFHDMAAWGSIVLATSQAGSSSVSYQSGFADNVFSKFVESGSLDEGLLPPYATANWIAFAQKLNKVSATSTSSVTFAVGQYRDNVIDYIGSDQVGFFKSTYGNVLDAVDGFFTDYIYAFLESQSINKAIYSETSSISSNYTELATAVVRQCYGAMEMTLPANDTADTSNPYVFLKEISTYGDVSTVDVVYPTSTILGVMSPDWIKYLLEPLAIFSESPAWTADYVVHDLGTYPVAAGRNTSTSEALFLETTGSFLIMAYQYQQQTGDKAWAQSHATLFQRFADYLSNNGLKPSAQLDTVDSIYPSVNQTNLAITSAIGLKAYGALTGNQAYTQTGQNFANTIYTQGLGTNLYSNGTFASGTPTHFTYNYGMSTSWGTVFNLFPDQCLHLNTFPVDAVLMQCSWYMSQATSVGIPYASEQNDIANGMWDMWIAAICPNDVDAIIGYEYAFFTNGKNTVPFADRFYLTGPQAGVFVTAQARPTLGTTFALLLAKGISFPKSFPG